MGGDMRGWPAFSLHPHLASTIKGEELIILKFLYVKL
jgi:hypothetical protein